MVALSAFAVVSIGEIASRIETGKTGAVANMRSEAIVLNKANEIIAITWKLEAMTSSRELERFQLDSEFSAILGSEGASVGVPENIRTEVSQLHVSRRNYFELLEFLPEELDRISSDYMRLFADF